MGQLPFAAAAAAVEAARVAAAVVYSSLAPARPLAGLVVLWMSWRRICGGERRSCYASCPCI